MASIKTLRSLSQPNSPLAPWINQVLSKNIPSYHSDDDLLAASVYLYRMYKDDPANRFADLFATAKFHAITQEDREMAEEVAQHFSKQIVMAQLRGEVSDFQAAVGRFISGNRRTLGGSDTGLVYRLPEYYENDMKVLALRDTYFSEHEHVDIIGNYYIRKLLPLDTISQDTRYFKVIQYWFKDIETNNPVMLTVDSKNQIRYIWDKIFNMNKDIGLDISGIFETRKHNMGPKYLHSTKWKLEL